MSDPKPQQGFPKRDYEYYNKLLALYSDGVSNSPTTIRRLIAVFLSERLGLTQSNYKDKCALERFDNESQKTYTIQPFEWADGILSGETTDYIDLMKDRSKSLFGSRIIRDKKGRLPLRNFHYKVKDRNGNEKNLFALLDQFEQIRHIKSHDKEGQLQTTDFVLEYFYVMEDVLTICDLRDTPTMQAIRDFKQEIQMYNVGTFDKLKQKENEIIALSTQLELRMQELQESKVRSEGTREMMYRLEYENAKLNDTINMFKQQQEQYIRTQHARQVRQAQQAQKSIGNASNKQEQLPQSANEEKSPATTHSHSESLPTVFSPADSDVYALTTQDLQDHIAIIQHSRKTLEALNARRNKVMDELLNQPKKKKRPVVVPLVSYGITQFQKRAIVVGITVCGILGAMYASGLLPTVSQPTQPPTPIALDTTKKQKPTGPTGMTQRELDSLQNIYDKYSDNHTPNSQQQQNWQHTDTVGGDQTKPLRKHLLAQGQFKPTRLVYIDVMTKSPLAVAYLMRNIKVDDLIQCNGTQFEYRNESSRKDIESKLRSIIDSAIPHSEPWGAMLHSVQTAQGISNVISTSKSGRGLPYVVYFVNDMSEKDMNEYSSSDFKDELQRLQQRGVTVKCLVGRKKHFNTSEDSKLFNAEVKSLFEYVL